MLTQLKRILVEVFKRLKSTPPFVTTNGSNNTIAETIARYDAAVDRHRVRLDEMTDANHVKEWFRSEMNSFFAEWPRGEASLSMAIKAAKRSRFNGELEEFLVQIEAHWRDPIKNPAP